MSHQQNLSGLDGAYLLMLAVGAFRQVMRDDPFIKTERVSLVCEMAQERITRDLAKLLRPPTDEVIQTSTSTGTNLTPVGRTDPRDRKRALPSRHVNPNRPYGTPATEAIKKYLASVTYPRTAKQISQATGYVLDTIRPAMSKLAAEKVIVLSSGSDVPYRGMWTLNDGYQPGTNQDS